MIKFRTAQKLVFVLGLFFANSASASGLQFDFWTPLGLDVFSYLKSPTEKRVAHITSDAMEGWTDLLVDLGPHSEVHTFRLVTSQGGAIEFNVNQLREGAVLKTDHGINGELLHTLTLQSDHFDSITGGDLKLIYLINGAPFFHKFGEFETRLRLKETGKWTFESGNDGRPFNSMFLASNRIFGKVVGVASVDVSWSEHVNYVP